MIAVRIDDTALRAGLKDLQRQIPYALAAGINNVVWAARQDTVASLDRNFTIAPARKKFLQRLVRSTKATKQRPEAILGTTLTDAPASSKDRSQLLGRHEVGGVRTVSDDTPFFIPTAAIRSGPYDVAPRSLYPKALRLMAQRTASGPLPAKSRLTTRGKVVLEGKRGTFVIDARQTANPNAWGVYQRTGPGKREIRALWFYRTRITLKPRLGFYATVQRIVSTRMDALMRKTIDHVISTTLARQR